MLLRSHIWAVLSHDAVNPLLLLSLQQVYLLGFGIGLPVVLNFQKQTSLSHSPAIGYVFRLRQKALEAGGLGLQQLSHLAITSFTLVGRTLTSYVTGFL